MDVWKQRLEDAIYSFVNLAYEAIKPDPVLQSGLLTGTVTGLANKLRNTYRQKSRATAEAFIKNTLESSAAYLNSSFGTKISLWPDGKYYDSPPPLQAAPVVDYGTPTVEQVAAAGPGVDLATVPQEIVLQAAIKAPESEAAKFVAAAVKEPDPNPPQVMTLAPLPPVPEGAPPPPPPPGNIQTLTTAPQPSSVGANDFVQDAIQAKVAVETIPEVQTMAVANVDPTFESTYSTTLPGGPQASYNLLGALAAGLGAYAGGQNLGNAALTGLTTGGIIPGLNSMPPAVTPGITPTQAAQNSNDELIKALLALAVPGGNVLGELGQLGSAAGLFPMPGQSNLPVPQTSIPAQMSIPTGLGSVTAGMPMAPVLQATPHVCYRAPKGYVVVELVGSNGQAQKVAMWKPMARSLKLWKARSKPPIKASEWKALKTAERVSKKAKTIAMKAGYSCRLK